ncbi:MAG: hypothetical protein O7I42_03895 [Alphaproteobacteria bacterium]|nr:hypothetical protein [Alphaproteobacteria bacterium]
MSETSAQIEGQTAPDPFLDARIGMLEKRLDEYGMQLAIVQAAQVDDLDLTLLEERLDRLDGRLASIEDTQECLVEFTDHILERRVNRRGLVVAAIFCVLLWTILFTTDLGEIVTGFIFDLGQLISGYLGDLSEVFFG